MLTRRNFILGICSSFIFRTRPILLIGDSLAFLLNRSFRVEAQANNFIPCASYKGGTGTWEWAKNNSQPNQLLKNALKRCNPFLVLIVLGTNDYPRYFRKNFNSNAKKVVELIQGHNSLAVWVTPPKIKHNRDYIFNGAQQSGADAVFDFRNLTLPLWNDEIHPSFSGNDIWAKEIFKATQHFLLFNY